MDWTLPRRPPGPQAPAGETEGPRSQGPPLQAEGKKPAHARGEVNFRRWVAKRKRTAVLAVEHQLHDRIREPLPTRSEMLSAREPGKEGRVARLRACNSRRTSTKFGSNIALASHALGRYRLDGDGLIARRTQGIARHSARRCGNSGSGGLPRIAAGIGVIIEIPEQSV